MSMAFSRLILINAPYLFEQDIGFIAKRREVQAHVQEDHRCG
jgi:hypothetical protein